MLSSSFLFVIAPVVAVVRPFTFELRYCCWLTRPLKSMALVAFTQFYFRGGFVFDFVSADWVLVIVSEMQELWGCRRKRCSVEEWRCYPIPDYLYLYLYQQTFYPIKLSLFVLGLSTYLLILT